jgi:hypothetical protein
MAEVYREGLALPVIDRADPEPEITHVRVTNRNKFPIEDMFDSRKYVFGAGKSLTVDLEVARHIFGFALETEEKALLHCMRRFGWNSAAMASDARKFFSNLEFKPVRFMLVEEAPEPRKLGRPRKEETQAAPDPDATGSASA